jgi:hypothetical protein
MPMRSCGRRAMNWSITSFAASRRFGNRSSASIESLRSSAIAMSMPSCSTRSVRRLDCGRASATTSSSAAASRSPSGRCASRAAKPGPSCCAERIREKRRVGGRGARAARSSSAAIGSRPASSHHGEANTTKRRPSPIHRPTPASASARPSRAKPRIGSRVLMRRPPGPVACCPWAQVRRRRSRGARRSRWLRRGRLDHAADLGERGLGLGDRRGEAGELDEVAGLQEAHELAGLERGDLRGGAVEGAAQLVGGAVEGVDAEAALEVALGDLRQLQVVVLILALLDQLGSGQLVELLEGDHVGGDRRRQDDRPRPPAPARPQQPHDQPADQRPERAVEDQLEASVRVLERDRRVLALALRVGLVGQQAGDREAGRGHLHRLHRAVGPEVGQGERRHLRLADREVLQRQREDLAKALAGRLGLGLVDRDQVQRVELQARAAG